MSNHKCQMKPKANYEVKQRYIPTFAHQPIFYQQPLRPYSSRCTPTFHSTVFDTEGYNIKTFHQKNSNSVRPAIKNQNIAHSNGQNQVRIQNVSLRMNASTDKWFDHTKEQIFLSIKDGQNHGYCKERKYVDLSSDLVFTDYNYEATTVNNVNPVKNNQFIRSITNTPHQAHLQQSKKQEQVQKIKPSAHDNHIQGSKSQQQVSPVPEEKSKQSLGVPQSTKTQKVNKITKPQKDRQLKLKGKKIPERPQTVHKARTVQQKPTFTVVRKSRVQH